MYVFMTRNCIWDFNGGWGWICKCFAIRELMKSGLKAEFCVPDLKLQEENHSLCATSSCRDRRWPVPVCAHKYTSC